MKALALSTQLTKSTTINNDYYYYDRVTYDMAIKPLLFYGLLIKKNITIRVFQSKLKNGEVYTRKKSKEISKYKEQIE